MAAKAAAQMGVYQVVSVIGDLEKQMKEAAKARDSECAAIPDSLHPGLHLLSVTAPAIRDGWAGNPQGLIACPRD